MSSDICQIRLNFEDFNIAGPANTQEYQASSQTDGICLDKWSTALTSGASVPVLCGVMTGEHVYLDVGMDSTDNAVISLILASTTITAKLSGITVADALRKYRVKTAQIPCWATYRAPDGCHRYLTDTVGQILSPNFADLTAGARGDNKFNARTDLMMQDLRTCIRRAAGYCCILFQVCNSFAGSELAIGVIAGGAGVITGDLGYSTQAWSFQTYLANAGDIGDGPATAAEQNLGIVDGGCSTDYVEIPDSNMGVLNYGAAAQNSNTRYCGNRFGFLPSKSATATLYSHAPVWDCTEPFEVNYFTDQVDDKGAQADAIPPTVDNLVRGFCLDYTQHAC